MDWLLKIKCGEHHQNEWKFPTKHQPFEWSRNVWQGKQQRRKQTPDGIDEDSLRMMHLRSWARTILFLVPSRSAKVEALKQATSDWLSQISAPGLPLQNVQVLVFLLLAPALPLVKAKFRGEWLGNGYLLLPLKLYLRHRESIKNMVFWESWALPLEDKIAYYTRDKMKVLPVCYHSKCIYPRSPALRA